MAGKNWISQVEWRFLDDPNAATEAEVVYCRFNVDPKEPETKSKTKTRRHMKSEETMRNKQTVTEAEYKW